MKIINTIKINRRVKKSQEIIMRAWEKFDPAQIALAWTGGKDSTLLLWLVKSWTEKSGKSLPHILFIDEGDLFDEIKEFSQKLQADWKFKAEIVRNDDVIRNAGKLGSTVQVSKLNQVNRNEIKKLGFDKPSFPFEPESFVGNHLMKTVPLNEYIRKNKIEAVITGIRADENPARSNESEFSPRQDPAHTRVHPILNFSEKDVWETIRHFNVPFVSLYAKGYRSLGAKTTTHKAGSAPAWEQDFKAVKERAGRQQDKEEIMEKLRKLGYM